MRPVLQPRLSAVERVAEPVLVSAPSAGLEETTGKAAPPSREHGHGFSVLPDPLEVLPPHPHVI